MFLADWNYNGKRNKKSDDKVKCCELDVCRDYACVLLQWTAFRTLFTTWPLASFFHSFEWATIGKTDHWRSLFPSVGPSNYEQNFRVGPKHCQTTVKRGHRSFPKFILGGHSWSLYPNIAYREFQWYPHLFEGFFYYHRDTNRHRTDTE